MKATRNQARQFATIALTGICLSGIACNAAPAPPAPPASPAPPAPDHVKKDAMWFLEHEPKPVFAKGNTLIPLTRWGWAMPYAVRVELCEHWGYALEFTDSISSNVGKVLSNPKSEDSRLLALAKSDPKRYPLAVLTPRPLQDLKFGATLPDAEQIWDHDAQGKKFDAPAWKTWSPEAPDDLYQKAADVTVDTLKQVEAKAPIAILLNGGEYGLNVAGWSLPYWSKDPKVLAAKGNKDWYEYISERKAREGSFITNAVRKAFPDRKLYIWYHDGCIPGTIDHDWTYDYKYMRAVSDLPDQTFYYKQFNSGWTSDNEGTWNTGDLLSQYLASVAEASAYGDPLSYNWVCAGWEGNKYFSDRDRYMGFLKCLYTGGQIGAVAGYFSFPQGGFGNPDLGDEPPSWLWQMMDLGQAQALFSHLENFLRQGDLLPGPGKNRLVKTDPAEEFPTGDANVRVLARKLRDQKQWLITAWAADGPARDVTVTIPDLGSVKLNARPAGSVYIATLKHKSPALELIDKDAMYPSAGFAQSR